MDTRTTAGLEELLTELELETPIPSFPHADVQKRPIDIYRSYLADTASKVLGCDSQLAYDAIQGANMKENGDLTLILPKLRLKTQKPKDLAFEALPKVRC
jgi:arginyl-tRNA synthetase